MVKVSIIVPVYNVEKYLERCLNSLINQTLQDIEIICTDDGSTDKSYEILLAYAEKDKRIKILQQENSKQGAARNRGLEIATGEFVTFVDADDWIELDYCELLYNAAQKYNVNIAAASMTRDKKHKVNKYLSFNTEHIYCGANEIVQSLDNHFDAAGKLYRRNCVADLRFQEQVLFEDIGYSVRAIKNCESLVTVPSAVYHYVSNPNSTLKQNYSVKIENDKISTALDFINYANTNNIKIKDWVIIMENHVIWKIKHYIDRKDFYLFGIKVFSKNIPYDNIKVILVFNTACFGDVLLCNSLCQNIKNVFPEAKLVFITDKNWKDVAQYQLGVDEVVIYDKKGVHKGFFGMLKFIREFKYKKPYASFITYKNERNFTIAKLLKSRFVLSPKKKDKPISTQLKHSMLLEPLTNKKIQNLPIKFELPKDTRNPMSGKKYVVLCCITKNKSKDMPLETAIELIRKFNSETNYEVVLTGAGNMSMHFSQELEESDVKFTNLVNKTSILELGAVLKGSCGLVSCDTGTMHFGYSLGVPTVAVFYEEDNVPVWGPSPSLYTHTVVVDKVRSAENIFSRFTNLICSVNQKS